MMFMLSWKKLDASLLKLVAEALEEDSVVASANVQRSLVRPRGNLWKVLKRCRCTALASYAFNRMAVAVAMGSLLTSVSWAMSKKPVEIRAAEEESVEVDCDYESHVNFGGYVVQECLNGYAHGALHLVFDSYQPFSKFLSEEEPEWLHTSHGIYISVDVLNPSCDYELETAEDVAAIQKQIDASVYFLRDFVANAGFENGGPFAVRSIRICPRAGRGKSIDYSVATRELVIFVGQCREKHNTPRTKSCFYTQEELNESWNRASFLPEERGFFDGGAESLGSHEFFRQAWPLLNPNGKIYPALISIFSHAIPKISGFIDDKKTKPGNSKLPPATSISWVRDWLSMRGVANEIAKELTDRMDQDLIDQWLVKVADRAYAHQAVLRTLPASVKRAKVQEERQVQARWFDFSFKWSLYSKDNDIRVGGGGTPQDQLLEFFLSQEINGSKEPQVSQSAVKISFDLVAVRERLLIDVNLENLALVMQQHLQAMPAVVLLEMLQEQKGVPVADILEL